MIGMELGLLKGILRPTECSDGSESVQCPSAQLYLRASTMVTRRIEDGINTTRPPRTGGARYTYHGSDPHLCT